MRVEQTQRMQGCIVQRTQLKKKDKWDVYEYFERERIFILCFSGVFWMARIFCTLQITLKCLLYVSHVCKMTLQVFSKKQKICCFVKIKFSMCWKLYYCVFSFHFKYFSNVYRLEKLFVRYKIFKNYYYSYNKITLTDSKSWIVSCFVCWHGILNFSIWRLCSSHSFFILK